ncbi:hypothetical protein CI109_106613 [Kwoniella shandongensis]|uniref:Phosphatidate cytidylyltransferase n=1 Tax=Kwoniella shandongensis TaxID=1734106 RepID=A0A5M6BRC9_9TREE|nr:uncharacterized protein CI109_007155 [Kwoniella shandongensis]KAA5524500.1 hypothetical protein CI109_007155 [Kwoniella shandongensis]
MSRRGPQPSFISKSIYDVLGADDNDEVDEEEVEEEPQQVEAPAASSSSYLNDASAAPLSKSARKRLAKAAAKTAEATSAAVEQISNTASAAVESVSQAAQKVNGDSILTLTEEAAPVQAVKQENDSQPPSASTASAVPEGSSNGATDGLKLNGVDAHSIVNGTIEALPDVQDIPATPSPESSAKVNPPSHSFAPELPETLPQPTSKALPANRKRKTPQDFTPSGPGDTMTPSSPSKIGVKFEDGVAPGEGEENEKIITPKKPSLLPIKKDRNVVERTTWTFIMIGGFIALLCLGHPYMILLVMLCQMLVYKEVTALFDLRDHGAVKVEAVPGEKGDRWSKTLNWYFFVVTNYFLYGESIIYYFKHIVFVDAYMIPFARNHRFISFMLYVVGFVGFVANLQKQYLRQQFALFCWVHISLLLIVVSSHFIVNNILEGLIWFFVPASLVICNDVMAYVCGKIFGRTPLIKLSPKKTVEGFVGAFICTLIFGLAWGTFFMRFPYMICPARDLGTNIFSQVTCRPNPVFVWRHYEITGVVRQIFQTVIGHAPPAIPYAPFQFHVLVMATFASLVAPFGGFFASGFKRAFNIKDFGHSIPGHGGMTDRMDCQFMMGLFSYVYYSSLIRIQYVTVGSIMQTVVTSLTPSEQLELLADLRRFLCGQGVKA